MNVTDTALLNLKIISKIPENSRIRKDNDLIVVDNGYLLFIKRFLFGDNREKAMIDINMLIDFVIDKCNDIVNSRYFKKNHRGQRIDDSFIQEKLDDEYHKQYELLENIYTELKNSTTGLLNLKKTYWNDTTTMSKIDIVISKIKNQIYVLEKKIFTSDKLMIETDTESDL
jgi:hypothetical protein